jgi:hypothetical protein
MKCAEELMYIRVSRVADGPAMYMCVYSLCARDSYFNYWSQLLVRHMNVRLHSTATKHVSSIRCMAFPRLRHFFILIL